MFSRLLSIDVEDESPELNNDWLSDKELQERERRRWQYGRNQVIQTVRRNSQVQNLQEEGEGVPDIQDNGNDSDDDDDDDNAEDYWQPNHLKRRWVPDQRCFGEDFETRTKLHSAAEGYEALLQDFKLLTDEEAFLANLVIRDGGRPNQVNSQMTQMEIIESLALDEDGLLTTLHPLAFAAKANNEDTPNFSQAMNGPDTLGYMKALWKKKYSNWKRM